MNKSKLEISDNYKRKSLIEYLKSNGYSKLKFEENQILSSGVENINIDQINESITLFLTSLNINSGSNGEYQFYNLMSKYISNTEVRNQINELI